MNIALDYDGTYTEDKELWDLFIEKSLDNGHKVFLVTMRYPEEINSDIKELSKKIDVIFTSRKAKQVAVGLLNLEIDVWIDDNPHWILEDSI